MSNPHLENPRYLLTWGTGTKMRTKDLILRCFATNYIGVWEAFCLDLNLAAQGDSFDEVKSKLEAQIDSYIEEAMTIHREHAEQLLNRKAPFVLWARYYFLRFMGLLYRFASYFSADGLTRLRDRFKTVRFFKEPLPLKPCLR